MRLTKSILFIALLGSALFSRAQLVANFTSNKTSGCSPLTVQFTNTSTGAYTSVIWRFGNGNISVNPSPSATYVSPGTYTVTLIVSNASGTDSIVRTNYITVFANPTANFTLNINNGCAPLPVQFTNTSMQGSKPITQYLWDFGDGNLGTQQSPQHIYTSSGTRAVTLTVTDSNGCQHSITKTNSVVITQTQSVNFTATNLTACVPPLTTTVNPTVTPAGTYTYLWTTSNGLSSSLPNPQFVFNNPGSFDVTLRVTNTSGCAETVMKKGYIVVRDVKASFNAASVCLGKSIEFTNTSVPDTSTASYAWSINGLQKATTKNHKETGLVVGKYMVDLTVNAFGCVSTKRDSVMVHPIPKPAFSFQPSKYCAVPINITMNNLSTTEAGSSFLWDYGNGLTSTNVSGATTITSLGVNNIKLRVTSPYGCIDSTFRSIKDTQPVAVIQDQYVKAGCKPYKANFTLTANSSSFVSYEWKYNNIIISTSPSFSFTFADTGKYVVTLKVVSAEGCERFLTDTIRVGQKFLVDFSVNKRLGCYSSISPVRLVGAENSGINNLKYAFSWYSAKSAGNVSGNDVNISFEDTGKFSIRFEADHNGCISDTTQQDYITVNPAKAFFSNVHVNCANDTVLFENFSLGKNKFKWYFGDGDSSELKNPRHKYDTSGIYRVKLIAFDTVFNCPDTMERLAVLPNAPKLDFSVSGKTGCAPFSVTLTNLSTVGPNAFGIIATQWVVNNNLFYNSTNAVTNLFNPGYYRVELRVTDARNCKYSLRRDSAVRVIGGNARIGLTAEKGCTPFSFTAFDSSATDYPIVSRKWVWSSTDSIVVPGSSIGWTYQKATPKQNDGYPIKLTVTDSIGCKFNTSRRVVPTNPIAEMNLNRNFACGSQTIGYQAETSLDKVCPPALYTWTIGSQVSSGSVLGRTYTVLDTTLAVKLQVTDSNGCIATKDTSLVIINRTPKIGFYANPQKLDCWYPIKPIYLFDTTILGARPIAKWEWKIGPNVSNLKNPELLFPNPGKYQVNLKIIDSAGCIDSVNIPDYVVIGGPVGIYGFSPKTGCMPHESGFQVQSPNAMYYIWDFGDGTVDTAESNITTYKYHLPGVYYPRLTLVDSSGTCEFGYERKDSIVVYDLPNPDFVSDKEVICINSTISFDNATVNKGFIAKWLWKVNDIDSSTLEGPIQKTFTKPGKFKVTLIATDNNTCVDSIVKPDFITVTDDTIAPATPIPTVVSNESNHVNFSQNTETDFKGYRVYYNYINEQPANYATLNNIEDTFFTQTNINTLINPYSYTIAAFDVCNNLSDTSTIHTTVELSTKPVINAIALKWTPYVGFDTIKQYEIWRNNADSGSTFVYINEVSGDSLAYIDTAISCFTTYYYKIKTVEQNGNNAFSWSDTSGSVPIYVPTMPPTKNIRATVVNDRSVLLQWSKRTHEIKFTYLVYKMRDDEVEPVAFKEVSDTFLLDLDVDVDNHSYTYYTYLKDECGGLSPASNMAKTILLKVGLQENDILKYDPIITFTKYGDWDNGIDKYKADFYYDSARAFENISMLTEQDSTFFHKYVNLEQIDYCYKVTAIERQGNNQESESNIACIETKPRLYAPNVFTINGDGLNDKFKLGGVFLESYHLLVYDRWGKVVFESFDIKNSWDGTIEGEPAKSDVYVYLAEGKGRRNQQITIKGNVTLVR
jgi:gliding motility-associated-like protein